MKYFSYLCVVFFLVCFATTSMAEKPKKSTEVDGLKNLDLLLSTHEDDETDEVNNRSEDVTFYLLLREMTDRLRITQLPNPAYKTAQASSYSRRSTEAGKKPGWWSNGDSNQFVRDEEKNGRVEHVMMDQKGPGAVVRIWATRAGGKAPFFNGTVRFYFDGSDKPAIEGPIQSILGGDGLAGKPLCENVSSITEEGKQGHNLYLPIPYAKSCKITYQHDKPLKWYHSPTLYYQINFRTYAKGTTVKTFAMEQLEQYRDWVEIVQKQLQTSGTDDIYSQAAKGISSLPINKTIKPGDSFKLPINGMAAIRELQLKLTAEKRFQALRSTVLSISFDGEETVWCPIGDFFGVPHTTDEFRYTINNFKTWYTSGKSNGEMTALWIMPYQKSCKIQIHNFGKQSVTVAGHVETSDYKWDDKSMYFHTTWHQYYEEKTHSNEGAEAKASDLNYVTIKGQGVYVGDTLTIYNQARGWWGEGDEKIFVDGEDFPSHFGTGTEDYYGYAWCLPQPFATPFHTQTSGEGNLKPGTSVNSRYRLLDGIPFEKSLQLDMELWHWFETSVDYAPTTFWYARPGATCNIAPSPKSAALPIKLTPTNIVKGAIEGESLKVLRITGGKTEIQNSAGGWGLSREQQLWWTQAKLGDKLTLEVNVSKAGKYLVEAGLVHAPDYGIVKITWADQPSVKSDSYDPGVKSKRIKLGEYDLQSGKQKLTIEITGKNKSAIPGYMFGLDYLKLTPVKN